MNKSANKYILGGVEYSLKEKYTLREWGIILKTISEASNDSKDPERISINLIAGGNLESLLNIMLDKKLEDVLYEDDVEEVRRIFEDFFSRKNALTKNINASY